MDTDARLKQIEKIAQNARTTWFGLLALLVFVGVTLMGHKDSDFFAFGAATRLPVANIDVPPTAFFIAAPILTAALYCYLHIYLLGLWDALGKIEQPQPREAQPLGNLAYPMLFTIAALWYRDVRRGDGSMPPRVLGVWTVIIAVLLGWVFGWVVLGFAWWRSMPAHDPLIAVVSGLALWAAIDFGINGFLWAEKTLRDPSANAPTGIRPLRIFTSAVLVIALTIVSLKRSGVELFLDTQDPPLIPLARADLAEAHLTAKPKDWLDYEGWKKEHAAHFRRREGLPADRSQWTDQQRGDLEAEYKERWASLTASLDKVSLRERDLRDANMRDAFLAGADLRSARMEEVYLPGARMEGADLSFARMEGAILSGARMEGADLSGAEMEGANLRGARMEGANLRAADLKFTDLMDLTIARTSLRAVDFTHAGHNMTQDEINAAYGDSGTILPEGLVAPCHWDDQTRERWDEDTKYLAWLKAGAIPIPRNPDGTCP